MVQGCKRRDSLTVVIGSPAGGDVTVPNPNLTDEEGKRKLSVRRISMEAEPAKVKPLYMVTTPPPDSKNRLRGMGENTSVLSRCQFKLRL